MRKISIEKHKNIELNQQLTREHTAKNNIDQDFSNKFKIQGKNHPNIFTHDCISF